MSEKNRGWNFLNKNSNNSFNDSNGYEYRNSDGSGSYSGADGSYGYWNADGSGSYSGADGSYGYWNADGSGSYSGADGSYGYRNADGSGSYSGADGSYGYWNADGSSSYTGADGSYDYSSSNDDYIDSSDDSYDSLATAAGLLFGLGAAAIAKGMSKQAEKERLIEEERLREEKLREEKRLKRQKESKIFKKRMKSFIFNNKKIMIGAGTNDLIGDNVYDVLSWLKDTGFNNVKSFPIKDIYIDSAKKIGEVEQVVINGNSWFEENSMIPYDAEIIVTFHVKKEIQIPFSFKTIRNRNYADVLECFAEKGFTNILTEEIDDLVTGWVKKDGSIQEVTINGKNYFKKGESIDYDSKIVIKYHTFVKKKHKY